MLPRQNLYKGALSCALNLQMFYSQANNLHHCCNVNSKENLLFDLVKLILFFSLLYQSYHKDNMLVLHT